MTPPVRPLVVRAFMTHDMKDEDIAALSTGRDEEFRRIMDAVARSRRAAPGPLQHVVLYGSRGFGKSFMARRVQIAVAALKDELGPVRFVLLPEEQHNLERSPHALLETIAQKLAHLESGGDKAYESVAFKWPKPGEEASRWAEAEAKLEKQIDAALPGGKGIVVVALENFDTLLASLFKEPLDEQRLRAWLDRPKNRLMLFATATGTVDIDYERPLFHAFESIRLAPWTPNDCIAYFNRRREIEGREQLDANQEGKARAIADFIGGTPRLAQLLAEVIDTEEALTVAQTMTALADTLAEYYRRRIEDLPPLARGLLDTLIRQGEPASQTQLAERVGADQGDIARSMGDLEKADIVRGRPARDSREKLYSVTDRVFAHYFRLRQGSATAQDTPLATILEFLKSFYSRDEQRAQALRHLQAGRPAEAALFSRLAMDGVARDQSGYTRYFGIRLMRYITGAPNILGLDLDELERKLNGDPTEAYNACRAVHAPLGAASAFCSVVKAQALQRMGLENDARLELEFGLAQAGNDEIARIITSIELACLLNAVSKNHAAAAEVGLALRSVSKRSVPLSLAAVSELIVADSLLTLNRPQESIEVASEAVRLSQEAGDTAIESDSYCGLANSFLALQMYDEALDAARRANQCAQRTNILGLQASGLRVLALALLAFNRSEQAELAVITARQGIEVATRAEDPDENAKLNLSIVIGLSQLGRHAESLDVARQTLTLARTSRNKQMEGMVLFWIAFNENSLDQSEAAWLAATSSVSIAQSTHSVRLFCAASREALRASFNVPRREALDIYRECREAQRNAGAIPDLKGPRLSLSELFTICARINAFFELDQYLAGRSDEPLDEFEDFVFYPRDGACIAQSGNRAEIFGAMAGLLPRIATFIARMPEAKRDHSWLPKLLGGFAATCRDPGLLRDVATLLTPDLLPQASEIASLLLALAEVDEAKDAETALSRMDPDVATLIRRLRDLPDPPPVPQRRKPPRPRKRPG